MAANLRLVTPRLASVPNVELTGWTESVEPVPEGLRVEILDTVAGWLGRDEVAGSGSLRIALGAVLEWVTDNSEPTVAESEGAQTFLDLVERERRSRRFLASVPDEGRAETPAEPPAEPGEDLSWGAQEFLRMVEVAEKVRSIEDAPGRFGRL